MTKRSLTAAALALVPLVLPDITLAQGTSCKPRERLASELELRYGEKISGAGIRSKDAVVELWQSPETGSWTMLMTRADGMACIIAHGTDWMGMPSDASVKS